MRETLRGTWILKEYEDSIDAGLTPKLLEYLLGGQSLISYDLDHIAISGFYPMRNGMLNYTDNTSVYSLSFEVSNKRLIIKIRPDSTITDFDTDGRPIERKTQSRIEEIDTADLIVEDVDTILRLNTGSVKKDFVKYDNSKCPDEPAYIHLVNSKFIAGKYYAIRDTGHTHHIIFTKCGNIEGAENIDASLTDMSEYGVSLTNFLTTPDAVEFYNPAYKMGRTLYWEVSQDSLILYQDTDLRTNRIVLVKSFK